MTPAPPEKPHRTVKVATIYWRPADTPTLESNLENFLRMVDQAAGERPDLILLSEGVCTVGIGLNDLEAVSEKVPGGRIFEAFAAKAREHKCYLCYGTYERDGIYIFNTAVLISPEGRVVGKFRKVHLPLGEDVAGLAPGGEFNVVDTPLGRLGFVICWDTAFPESIRSSALEGAEIVLVPIWGGNENEVKVAARESGVFVVTASFDMKSMVIDPQGEELAATWKDLGNGVAAAECDLDQRVKSPWTGDPRSYIMRQRRPDAYGPIVAPIR